LSSSAIVDFTVAQLRALPGLAGPLRAAGLSAALGPLEYGAETIEVTRPRDPDLALWLLNATEGGHVVITELPSGRERMAPSVGAALAWVVAAEQGGGAVAGF